MRFGFNGLPIRRVSIYAPEPRNLKHYRGAPKRAEKFDKERVIGVYIQRARVRIWVHGLALSHVLLRRHPRLLGREEFRYDQGCILHPICQLYIPSSHQPCVHCHPIP